MAKFFCAFPPDIPENIPSAMRITARLCANRRQEPVALCGRRHRIACQRWRRGGSENRNGTDMGRGQGYFAGRYLEGQV